MASSGRTFTDRLKSSLPLVGRKDAYQEISQEDGTVVFDSELPGYESGPGAVQLDDAETTSFLNSEGKRKPRRHLVSRRVRCGPSWSLFFKVVGILAVSLLAWQGIKLLMDSNKAPPGPVETMPVFSESLGCAGDDAPHIYNSSTVHVSAPLGLPDMNHFFEIRGAGIGTVTISAAPEDATEVQYSMTVRTNNQPFLDEVRVSQPHVKFSDGSIDGSHLRLSTPYLHRDDPTCVRFDVVLYVPRHLRKLHVASFTHKTHVKFDTQSHVDIPEKLFVTLYGTTSDNMIMPSEHIVASTIGLEVRNGWIVGDVAVADNTEIKTQQGRGVINIKAHPVESSSEEPSRLYTVSGRGRTDVAYLGAVQRRPIRGVHMVGSPNTELYVTYAGSGFNGRLELDVGTSETRNVNPLEPGTPVLDTAKSSVKVHGWTDFVGSPLGPDEIRVETRGWAGVYM